MQYTNMQMDKSHYIQHIRVSLNDILQLSVLISCATLMAEIRKPRFGAGIPNRVASVDCVPHKIDMKDFVAYPLCKYEVSFLTRCSNKQ
jgi:hypothetical protein